MYKNKQEEEQGRIFLSGRTCLYTVIRKAKQPEYCKLGRTRTGRIKAEYENRRADKQKLEMPKTFSLGHPIEFIYLTTTF